MKTPCRPPVAICRLTTCNWPCPARRCAAETLAKHAKLLAPEMEHGVPSDRSGPDALRLFAAVVMATNQNAFEAIGHA